MNDELIIEAWRCDLPVRDWKFVLVAMATFAYWTGVYDGGTEYLSQVTGLSGTSVENALIALESRGIISLCSIGAMSRYKINLMGSPNPEVKTPQIVS